MIYVRNLRALQSARLNVSVSILYFNVEAENKVGGKNHPNYWQNKHIYL